MEWNDRFAQILTGFLESERSFDAFLGYLGMPPEETRIEISSGSEVQKMCALSDGKALRVYFSSLEDSILVYVEEISKKDSSAGEQQSLQKLLEKSLDFLSEEPAFILENGRITAANALAKDILRINSKEMLDADSLVAGLGVPDPTAPLELNGEEFKVEDFALGNLRVFRLKKVAQGVSPSLETSGSGRRSELLSKLITSENFYSILDNLREILKT